MARSKRFKGTNLLKADNIPEIFWEVWRVVFGAGCMENRALQSGEYGAGVFVALHHGMQYNES